MASIVSFALLLLQLVYAHEHYVSLAFEIFRLSQLKRNELQCNCFGREHHCSCVVFRYFEVS